ncbi:MAG: methyltransferase domain-containing protein [Armatimonadia bacterium]
MKRHQFQELYELEDFYWWFIGRRELVRDLVRRYSPDPGQRLLDAGCGTGGTLHQLEGRGALYGCDRSQYALTCCLRRGLGCVSLADVTSLPYDPDTFGVVVSCDVLEHVPDDRAAVAEMVRVLRPGGHLVLTVPAHRFLWSEHDEALAHLRRYSAKELRALLQEAGLQVVKLSPVVVIAFPPILLFRLLQRLRRRQPDEPKTDLRVLPAPLNKLLIWALRLENWLLRYLNLPVGTSLVAVARKP